ncbi:MAG: hypothetical protein WA764_27185, partial [Pseudolabrys sp.]
MKPARLKLVDRTDMRPVTSTGRSANKTYRTREHLTEAEIPDSFNVPVGGNQHVVNLADVTFD